MTRLHSDPVDTTRGSLQVPTGDEDFCASIDHGACDANTEAIVKIINVFVRMNGATRTLYCTSSMPIGELLHRISEALGIPHTELVISANGRLLKDDERSISDWYISDGTNVTVSLRVCGGARSDAEVRIMLAGACVA